MSAQLSGMNTNKTKTQRDPQYNTVDQWAIRMSEQIALARKRKVECNYFFRRECPGTLRDNMCDRGVGTIKDVVLTAS